MVEDKYDEDHRHHNIITAKLSYTESVHCTMIPLSTRMLR